MFTNFYLAGLGALVAALLLMLRWYLARRQLLVEAAEEYEARRERKPGTVTHMDSPDFIKMYVGAHEPRWALYGAAAVLANIMLSPVMVVLLMSLWPVLVLGLENGPWYDVGYYPWMFFMFFGMSALWALVGAAFARLHHQRAPENYHAGLARARGEPLDQVEIPRQRPKWAKRARPSWAPKLPRKDSATSSESSQNES